MLIELYFLVLRQNFCTGFGNQNGMLKLRSWATISCKSCPVIFPCYAIRASQCKNWFCSKNKVNCIPGKGIYRRYILHTFIYALSFP